MGPTYVKPPDSPDGPDDLNASSTEELISVDPPPHIQSSVLADNLTRDAVELATRGQRIQGYTAPPAGPPAPSLDDIRKGAVMKPGERGDSVGQIQEMVGMKPPSGIYDAATQRAVRHFQEDHGLHSKNGEVGPQTLDALEHPEPKPAPTLDEIMSGQRKLHAGEQGPAVAQIQKLLGMKNPTGIYDAATQRAVRQFQEDHGLHSNSFDVGAQTLKALEHPEHKPAPTLDQIEKGPKKLQAGEKGDAVTQIQKMLGMKNPTGIYDAATQRAVRQFQEQHHLHSNSFDVGRETLDALKKAHQTPRPHHPNPPHEEGPDRG